MKKLITCLILILMVSAIFAEVIPDFKLPDAAGKNVALQELLGKGLLLLIFGRTTANPVKMLCRN